MELFCSVEKEEETSLISTQVNIARHYSSLRPLNFLGIEQNKYEVVTQSAFTCSKLTMKMLVQDVKYVQS